MATTQDVSNGNFIRFNGELCQITEWEHRTPGNLRAFYQCKMRVIKTGKSAEYRFRSGESVDLVRVEMKPMQYLYREDANLVLMDNQTYEQVYVPAAMLGDSIKFLKENTDIDVAFENGEEPVFALTPNFVELLVTYTEPAVKGDTATNVTKAATVETGAEVRVPLFVNEGDKIRIDSRTGAYQDRVK